MNKKKVLITVSILAVLAGLYLGYKRLFPGEYKVKADEIALKIRLDVREDIGLVVYDYTADGHQYGGGMSNADRSMIRHDDTLINVWNKEDFSTSADSVDLTMRIRIITEYADPNFDNIYPDEITELTDPVSWQAGFGKMYEIVITGNKSEGYKAVLQN